MTAQHLALQLPSPLVELDDERLTDAGVRVLLKRDDLIHPELTGNKWRKLKYNLEAARECGARTLLTFGGAYSNHIRAVAAAGHYFGFGTVGVIRGEEHRPLNETLAYATRKGMRLTYLDRTTYREKAEPWVIARLRGRFGDFYLIPEGGSNRLAIPGCAELVDEITEPFEVICCPVGTGGTLAGIASALRAGQRAVGFSVLKGSDFLYHDVAALQSEALGEVTDNWIIETEFHHGGYAKTSDELEAFIAEFEELHELRLDSIYTGKMVYGLFRLIERDEFPSGTTMVAVITG
ncbi:MAG: pyridoxal-phosphate dependent enzyme [Actinophytocola sp.]|nr:pyridoxal-phosphate dependent enzyme [Actinophytocola sp.]